VRHCSVDFILIGGKIKLFHVSIHSLSGEATTHIVSLG